MASPTDLLGDPESMQPTVPCPYGAIVDAYHAEITARGAKPKAPPMTKPWGMREFALETPEGHRLTFGTELGRG